MKLKLGDLVLSLDARELRRGETPIAVEPKVFDLIAFLFQNRGRVVGRDELMRALWPDVVTTPSSLNRAVSLAREALADRSRGAPIIETVRGRGYRIRRPVEWIDEPDRDAFVGRDAELAVGIRGFERARDGRGGTVVISGEAGIGKSRLAEELAAHARARGAEVLWGRCREGGGRPAFWPWSQVLRSLAGTASRPARELGEAGLLIGESGPSAGAPARSERLRIFDAVARLLSEASRPRPLVLIFDDLHWADRSSLQLLSFVAGDLRSERILLVAIHRDGEAAPPLQAALAEATRGGWRRDLRLRGLDRQAVVAFLRGLSGEEPAADRVSLVLHRSDGNPLFLQELAHHAGGEGPWSARVPESVGQVIRSRLTLLPPDCVELLGTAAVVGRRFPVPLVASVAGCREDEALDRLDPARRAGILEVDEQGGDRRLRFRHELLREVLYEDLPAGARVRAHLRLAQALEDSRSLASPGELSEIAHHFREGAAAGGGQKALDYAIRAAAAQADQLAFEEASQHLELALQLLDARISEDGETRVRLLIDLGSARNRAGDVSGAETALWAALDAARGIASSELHARAAAELATTRVGNLGLVPERRIAVLESALAELPEADGELRVRVLGSLSADLYWADLERARTHAREGLAMARRLGHADTLLSALDRQHDMLASPSEASERRALVDEMLALARERADPEMEFQARWYRMRGAMVDGDAQRFDTELEELDLLADRMRQPLRQAEARAARAARALWRGELAEAESLVAPPSRSELARAGDHRIVSHVPQLGLLRIAQGRTAEVDALLEEGVRRFPRVLTFQCALLYSWIHQPARLEDATARFDALARSGFEGLRPDLAEPINLALLSEVCAVVGNRPAAALLLERLRAHAGTRLVLETYVSLGSAARYQGLLAALLGDQRAAQVALHDAIASERRAGAALWEARAERSLACLLERCDRRDAERHLGRARAIETRLGLAP